LLVLKDKEKERESRDLKTGKWVLTMNKLSW